MSSTTMSFNLPSDFLAKYDDREPEFGFNGLGVIVYKRTYSRLMADDKREEWFDTILRVVNGLFSYQKRSMGDTWDEHKALKSAKETFERMFSLKFLTGGRGLWVAGTPVAERNSMCLYNCAYISTVDIDKGITKATEPFRFLMDLMMLGVGVGFDIAGEYKIRIYEPSKKRAVYQIEDTREGWVESVRVLLESYFIENSPTIEFDYSIIRGKGLPLKSFGGISSGSGPLKSLHDDISDILDRSAGEFITCRNIVDIMNLIGVCVVAGNCRRCLHKNSKITTARGLVDIQDVVIGDQVLTLDGFKNVYDVIPQGAHKLVKVVSTTGEYVLCTPNHKIAVKTATNGYIWKQASKLTSKDMLFIGTSEISGNTATLPKSIHNNINIPPLDVELAWFLGVMQTSGNLICNTITLSFCETASVIIPAVVVQLQRFSQILDIEFGINEELGLTKVICHNDELCAYFAEECSNIPLLLMKSSLFTKYAFISGMIDVRYINRMGSDVVLFRSLKEHIAKMLNLLIMSTGVHSKISTENMYNVVKVNRLDLNRAAKYCKNDNFYESLCGSFLINMFVRRNNSKVFVAAVEKTNIIEETWDLSVEDNHQFYADGILVSNSAEIAGGGIHNKPFLELKNYEKNPERAAFGWTSNNTVMAKHGDSFKEVSKMIRKNGEPGVMILKNMQEYSRMCDPKDFVDRNATFTNPCAEITLESGETCNLAEVFLPRIVDYVDFRRTLKCAYIAAKSVTLLNVHWENTNEIIKRNRRLGISVSGVVQFLANHTLEELRQWLDNGYHYLRELDKRFSASFHIPESIKLTCVKPSGTTSLLSGSTPGLHYPISRFYIRRVRIAKSDKIMELIREIGYKYSDCALGTDNYVVDIPVDVGEGVKVNPSMWEQLLLTEFMQKWWADNQTSSTITFDPETEGDKIESALDHFQYTLKSISFLPKTKDVYPQMPYETITEEEYKELSKTLNLTKRRTVKIRPSEETRVVRDEVGRVLYCDSESCQIVI